MIKKIYFKPRYEVEFEGGECVKFPEGFNNEEVKVRAIDDALVITHPSHPPQALKPQGWAEIHPCLDCIKQYRFISQKNGGYEIYGDMNGPFKTIAWFALGRNPNHQRSRVWNII